MSIIGESESEDLAVIIIKSEKWQTESFSSIY